MKIIAIDPGLITGWADDHSSGTWNLKPKSYESAGMKLIKFKASFCELVNSNLPEMDPDNFMIGPQLDLFVAYEKPGGRHYNGIRSHSNFEGVLMQLCEEMKIQYKGYSAAEIKRHATGKGNCNKEAMVASAAAKWPEVKIIDDNHADALWLHNLAESEFQTTI